jgi:hypothetical protein
VPGFNFFVELDGYVLIFFAVGSILPGDLYQSTRPLNYGAFSRLVLYIEQSI